MGGKGTEVGWVVAKGKIKKQDDTIEFRVAMMSTCTHKGPIFHYKALTDVCRQWEPYQVSNDKLFPYFGAISPCVDSWSAKSTLEKQTS